MAEEDGIVASDLGELVTGSIFIEYNHNKQRNEDDTRSSIQERLRKSIYSHGQSIANFDANASLDSLIDILLPNNGMRSFYLSNCSNKKKRECGNKNCPLGDKTLCSLKENNCSSVLLRPKCDVPSLDNIFPGNEVLAIKCFLQFCPHEFNGSVFSIMDIVWAPKCDRRSYEAEIQCRIQWSNTEPWGQRSGNIFGANLVSTLSPVSIITRDRIQDWIDYLDWRRRLIMANKRGIRYIAYRLDSENGFVIFTVVAENEDSYKKLNFWRRGDTVFACQLKNSLDQWTYQEADGRKDYGKELGDFQEERILNTDKLPNCDWDAPFVVDLTFAFAEEIIESIDKKRLEEGTDVDIDAFLKTTVHYPERGFLSLSSVGDEALINRMRRAVTNFAEDGSNASPFLASYLFDITQARLPRQTGSVAEWNFQHLNDAQKQAVETMLAAPDIALIQGPPGTGKTTVIAEAIYQFVKQGKTILVASQSIAAVDNALDRLANIPEIRAVRLKKENKFTNNDRDTTRYAENDVLANFYETLGKPIKDQLAQWEQEAKQKQLVGEFIEKLNAVADRLADEENQQKVISKQLGEAQKQLKQAQACVFENQLHERQLSTGKMFVVMLENACHDDDSSWHELPPSVIELFESTLLEKLTEMERHGIFLFPERYDKDFSIDNKCRLIKLALSNFKTITANALSIIIKDIERLNGMTGEKVVGSQDALRLAENKRDLDELDRQMDAAEDEGDDELYGRLEQKRRVLKKNSRELEANASLPQASYKLIFSRTNEAGQDIARYITSPERTRTEVLALLGKYQPLLSKWKDEVNAAIAKTSKEADNILRKITFTHEAVKEVKRSENNITLLKGKQDESTKRLNGFRGNASALIQQMSKDLNLPSALTTIQQAQEWCARALSALNRREEDAKEEKKLLMPLMEQWVKQTSSISQSDRDQVLPIYLKNCSVVGITCSSDDRLLRNNNYDRFDVVIIDEVSKTTPPELLLSMTMGEKTILVGDHRQLPPLFSDREPISFEEKMQQDAEDDVIPDEQKISRVNFIKYRKMVEASLFKEHFEGADDRLKSMLWVQHRMHPDIMGIINEFYENQLVCGIEYPDVARDHHLSQNKMNYIQDKGHSYWIDSTKSPDHIFWAEDPSGKGSYENFLEAQLILQTLKDMDGALQGQVYPEGSKDENGKSRSGQQIRKDVGIIAFYGKQTGLLRRVLKRHEQRYGRFKNLVTKVETVDRFQGQERDYIFVSMTRNPEKSIRKGNNSFVAKFERINVAFSRAKELLMIFGSRIMFSDYEIDLPPLLHQGAPKRQRVYKNIIDKLAREGRLLSSDQIISESKWVQCLQAHKKPKSHKDDRANSQRGKRRWTK